MNLIESVKKFFGKTKEVVTKELIHKVIKPEYPCVGCVVFASCTKMCDKLEMDEDKIFKHFMEYNTCIDCGSEKFSEGPTGGMCVNVKCVSCGHWFNLALPLFIQRIRIN